MSVFNDSLRINELEECLLDVWDLLECCMENELTFGQYTIIGVQFIKADVKEVLGELIEDRETQRDISDLEDQIYQLQKRKKSKIPEQVEISWSKRDV